MMRSFFFSIRFHSEIISFFSVNFSAYQSSYSMLITGSYKHSAIPELSLNTNVSTHVFQSLSLNHKTSHQSCDSGSMPNTKHFMNHVLQGPCPTQPTYIYIYIINNWLTPNIQVNHHVHMQWVLRPSIK